MKILNLSSGMKVGSGLALGVGAVILAPIVVPVLAGVLKSLTKAGIKGGLLLYERGKVIAAEAKETVEDLAAEAKAEMSEERGVEAAGE